MQAHVPRKQATPVAAAGPAVWRGWCASWAWCTAPQSVQQVGTTTTADRQSKGGGWLVEELEPHLLHALLRVGVRVVEAGRGGGMLMWAGVIQAPDGAG